MTISFTSDRLSSYRSSAPKFETALSVTTPGRVNVIGEHTDYNGGKVLPGTIEQSLTVEFSDTADRGMVTFESESLDRMFQCTIENARELSSKVQNGASLQDELALAANDRWVAYPLGALLIAHEVLCPDLLSNDTRSLHFRISSTLPSGSGLSSSAALCVGMIQTACLIEKVKIDPVNLAAYAQRVEHQFAGTLCGLMDQLCITHGAPNTLNQIDFLNDTAAITPISLPKQLAPYKIVMIDSTISHSLADGEYNKRRKTCAQALKLLNAHFEAEHSTLGEYATKQAFAELWDIPRTLDSVSRLPLEGRESVFEALEPEESSLLSRRVRHVITEILRVELAVDALQKGSLEVLSYLMRESHRSLRSNYEVSCNELEWLFEESLTLASSLSRQVGYRHSVPALIGPRLCGGGFGGSTVQFVHEAIFEKFCEHFTSGKSRYTERTGLNPKVLETKIAGGIICNDEEWNGNQAA